MRRFIQIILLLVLLVGGGGSWYLYERGLTRPWRDLVIEELRRRGVEVSFGSLTVEPFRGLVAKNVRVFDSPKRERTLAQVNEMIVEANYANAVRGKPFLDSLTLVDAALQIPLDTKDPTGPTVTVEKLNTRIVLPADRLVVSRLTAVLFGIHVSASGQIVHPDGWRSDPPGPDKTPDDLMLMTRVLDEFRALKFLDRPRLDIHFGGDLAMPESIVVEASLATGRVERGTYRLDALDVALSWHNEALLLHRFEARDAVGRLHIGGTYRPSSRQLDASVRSGMDLAALLRTSGLWEPGELHFESTPQIDAVIKAKFEKPGVPRAKRDGDGQMDLSGKLRMGKFAFGKIAFDQLAADFAWDGKRWAVRDFVLKHRVSGEIHGDVMQDYDTSGQGDFRLGLTSTINPESLAPFFRGNKPWQRDAAARLAMFKFPDAPEIKVSARGSAPGWDTMSASGDVKLGRCSYRGVDARSVNASLRFSGNTLHVDNLDVQRTEGPGACSLTFDFAKDIVLVKNARMGVFPLDVAQWIDPDLAEDIRPYRFGKQPPFLTIDGVVDRQKGGKNTRLVVKLDAENGMDYTFSGKELKFNKVEAKMLFDDGRVKLTDVRGELFDGILKGSADISTMKGKPGHAAEIRFIDVNFEKLTKLYFDYHDSKGKLNGVYNFNGKGDDARTMRGEGKMEITEGNVFAIPFLGPFSDVLNKIVPGMGYNLARRAALTFAIADGIITTKNLEIEGKGFSMFGDGRIWFLDDRMDFDMRLNAQGLPGVLLLPVSALLEYRSVSKFSEPDWRAKVIPKFQLPRTPKPTLPVQIEKPTPANKRAKALR